MGMTDSSPLFDLAETDRLLTTTRAVRTRLDLERPVPREVLLDCVRIAQQAPTGSNTQTWRWVFVTDPARKQVLADFYRAAIGEYLDLGRQPGSSPEQNSRILDSAVHLANNLERVPVLALPCVQTAITSDYGFAEFASVFGSIIPAVWSFQLALRSRGLGSCYTTFHLKYADDAARLLKLPADVSQVALLPVAYTLGTDFKRAGRPAPETIIHWDEWSAE